MNKTTFFLRHFVFLSTLTRIAGKAFVHRGFGRLRVLFILTTPSPNPHQSQAALAYNSGWGFSVHTNESKQVRETGKSPSLANSQSDACGLTVRGLRTDFCKPYLYFGMTLRISIDDSG